MDKQKMKHISIICTVISKKVVIDKIINLKYWTRKARWILT